MKKRIYLSSPHMSEEKYELNYVKKAFKDNWIAPIGPNIDDFEKDISKKLSIKAACALSSGTAAIHMAIKAANIKPGDIVICQSLTFSATANPIIYEKAVPVFIDSDITSWNMSPKYLEEALIKYPNAKAVIVVHIYGLSAQMDEIVTLCKKYNVILIEDAAESLGTTYKNKFTGTFGDFGILSFNGNKIITSSGGGMLLSNNVERIKKAKFWSTQSRDKARHYQHSELGYNYRMSNISAGIGRGQLKVLDKRIKKKKHIYNFYYNALKDIEEIKFMPNNDWDNPNYWLTCIILTGDVRPINIIEKLEKNNIESRPIWKPMHMQPFFKKYDFIGSDVSKKLFEKGLCLPSDTKLSYNDLEIISNLIREACYEKKN
jgi:dTDP-4-amino-4,6-dideoxygalactose transaminase